ncbi:sodium:solute symporter [Acetobacter sp. TBRC 12305]|uniref:Sodium:solute symporter n=1 Tax=Acetobacter garciniae TaxID=2817435 RepID=A0A939HMH8_9PROT|nr:sodium:solute symporter [Acetobacter garciniae]MBO1323569.1 sodium:solute symporter [Acetobacter garciniae]MBX0343258.1 sodium:solute symporter [Acetobacter garciniae]
MTLVDLVVMAAYLAGMPALSLVLAGRSPSAHAYLEGHKDLPWWALCLSLVATETSTLTLISVPGVAYGSGMVFSGLALGYLLGRAIVAWRFLPLYQQGRMLSAYDWLGQRFGPGLQRAASGTFLITRLLAEAVRLFAGMLPLAAILDAMHVNVPKAAVLCTIMGVTLLYTLRGGLRAVVWSDSIQFVLYLLGAGICAALLWHAAPANTLALLGAAGKFQLFTHHTPPFTSAFTPLAAIGGGAVLSLASHGTDQLMVQRVLAARSLRDARLALMGSAVGAGLLFTLLSGVGVLLWVHHGGVSAQAAGFSTPDAIFPAYIAQDLPAGLRGLLVAGILAATMGSLSSTLSAMTAATVGDFAAPCRAFAARLNISALRFAQLVTVVWAAGLCVCAGLFAQGSQSVIMLGLSIAACGYGPILGSFVAGMLIPRLNQADLLPAFCLSVPLMLLAMQMLHPYGKPLAFAWLIVLGMATLFALALTGYAIRQTRHAPR